MAIQKTTQFTHGRAIRTLVPEQLSMTSIQSDWEIQVPKVKVFHVEEKRNNSVIHTAYASCSNESSFFDRGLLQFTKGEWKCLHCKHTQGCTHIRHWDKLRHTTANDFAVDESVFNDIAGMLTTYLIYYYHENIQSSCRNIEYDE